MRDDTVNNEWGAFVAKHRWSVLLGILTFLIVLDAFDGRLAWLDSASMIAMSLLFLGVVGAIERRTWLRAMMATPVLLWFALVLINEFSSSRNVDIWLFYMSAVLLFGCMITSFRQLFAPVHSEYERLSSGIFGYMLLAMIWGLIYWRIEISNPGAFNLPDGTNATRAPFVYYSMITMTTVGYGEITPAASLPRTLAGLQAIAGTMFVAIFIGRIVGRLK